MHVGVHVNPVFRTWCKYRRIYSYNMLGFELSFIKKPQDLPAKKDIQDFYDRLIVLFNLFACIIVYLFNVVFLFVFLFPFLCNFFFFEGMFLFVFCFVFVCLFVRGFFFFLFVCFLLFFFSWLNFYFIIWISSTKTIVKANNRNVLQTIHYMLNIEYIIYVYTINMATLWKFVICLYPY